MRTTRLFLSAVALLWSGLSCLMISPAQAQETVDVVNATINRKAIVVEYDLAEDADFVRLFVSLDGGASYLGPMIQVSGDVANVKAGFGRKMVWDVLKEWDIEAFINDSVRFKLNIMLKERWPKETFFTLNAAYGPSPQGSFGFSLGQVKHFGWFVSVMSNGPLLGPKAVGDCDALGFLPDGHLMQYSGETSRMRISLLAGGMLRLSRAWSLRAGLGYGRRTLWWQTTDGQWYRNTAFSLQGIDLSAGVQCHFHDFVISLEAVTTQFQNVEAKIGFGYAL